MTSKSDVYSFGWLKDGKYWERHGDNVQWITLKENGAPDCITQTWNTFSTKHPEALLPDSRPPICISDDPKDCRCAAHTKPNTPPWGIQAWEQWRDYMTSKSEIKRQTIQRGGSMDDAVKKLAAIQRLVDEQAEDEGLWFLPHRATEDTLQEALRKLHAEIER